MHGATEANLEDLQDTLHLGAAGSNFACFSTISVTNGTGKKETLLCFCCDTQHFGFYYKIKK